MGLLIKAKNEQAAAKIGAFGGQGSGKTTTMSQIAIGLSLSLHKGAPVAFYDTEKGSDFARVMFEAEGIELLRSKTRAIKDLLTIVKEAEAVGCCALVVDSVSHVWKDLMDSFCARKNISRIQFEHWRELKGVWGQWTDAMINSRLHMLVAGRAGKEYEYQEDEGSGKKELITKGTKMKAEGDFGYEPDFLVEMWLERENAKHTGSHLVHRAIVLKDRSMRVNGHEFEWADMKDGYHKGDWKLVYQEFEPYIKFLNVGGPQVGIDATRDSQSMFDESGRAEWSRREKDKKICLEEFEATMVKLWPSQDARGKAIKMAVIENLFSTRSWTKVEMLPLETAKNALTVLRGIEAVGNVGNYENADAIVTALETIKVAQQIESTKESEQPALISNGGRGEG